MLVLLPPSETKRPGGDGGPLDLDALRLPSLRGRREAAVDALVELSAHPDAAARVLKLSERQRGEVATNAALRRSATMPAVDRYTGVLFDALDAGSLDADARAWLGEHVLIQTAPLGPVGALDPLPAYRLAAGASLPGIGSQKRHWAAEASAALAAAADGLILDMRSKAYVDLGPVPADVPSVYVSVVTEGEDGAVRALNHFNKKGKGRFARLLAETRPEASTVADLLAWARAAGVDLRPGAAPGEVLLVVAE